MIKDRIYLDRDWRFSKEWRENYAVKAMEQAELVQIPHNVADMPFHYFDENIYQMISCYQKTLDVPQEWEGKTLLLTFEGIAHDAVVYVNGKEAGSHHSGYTAFTMDISSKVIYGAENLVSVKVDSRESLNIPPFGFVIDYMTYGGIYRDVYLEVKESVYIKDVFLRSRLPLSKIRQDAQSVGLKKERSYPAILVADTMTSALLEGHTYYIRQELTKITAGEKDTELAVWEMELEADTIKREEKLQSIQLWNLDSPVLYDCKTILFDGEDIIDEKTIRIGFRDARFRKEGFYLNGKKIKLRGLNRHQSYPYVGYAMPASMQKLDADILKRELGANAVRTSHYPQAQSFLDRCDEIGLLVFTEIPGWQHIGDEAWKAQAVENVKEMVSQYRNHASIILWGVRINESQDDDILYTKTNQAAHELDDSRQTGGVRFLQKSHLLEDVYTYNDFSYDGTPGRAGCMPKKEVTTDMDKGYLISEYNGHMYPTKTFDCERVRQEHALRHAQVLNAAAEREGIAGSFAWCMFDYNTHKDFGSGDRICYHGVMDMFRNPKLAAAVYASQKAPKCENDIVLEVTSTMDIGEYPASNRGAIYALTNADSVRVYKNQYFIREYTREDSPYKSMPHGPIKIDDFIGNRIAENEKFTARDAEIIKQALIDTAGTGMANMSLKTKAVLLTMAAKYKLTMKDATDLYNRYVGDWGGASTEYRFEAVYKGEGVKAVVKAPVTIWNLQVEVDHKELQETETYDVAAIRMQAIDQNGNVLPFSNEPVQLRTEGPIELIGPDIVPLRGGMAGAYVKTIGESGEASLHIRLMDQREEILHFTCAAVK